MAKDLFNRYVWLVDTIYRAGRITIEEINLRWLCNSMSGGDEIPLRTFHNHRKAIEDLFDINIECDKCDGYKYYIENTDDIERGGIRTWLLNSFAASNLINESHKLKSRIQFEHIPSGLQYLTLFIEAMHGGKILEMTYQSFWREHPTTFEIEPYCMKLFKQRWYVVAKSEGYDTPRIYSLDRIHGLKTTERKFSMPKTFDAEIYFNNSFGIIVDDDYESEEVKVKVFGNQVKYFRVLPLHYSQQETLTEDTYSIFSYYIKPTFDLRQELLSHGIGVEVLSPAWFRNEMREIAEELKNLYSDKTVQ